MKLWNEMNEVEREEFKLTKDYLDPANPACVPWGEWSDAAVGAVFRAHKKGNPVQFFAAFGEWTTPAIPLLWGSVSIYRIPPEPKRETVRLVGQRFEDGEWAFSDWSDEKDTHALTFPTLDGNPVLDKCPHCGTAPIDIEELK